MIENEDVPAIERCRRREARNRSQPLQDTLDRWELGATGFGAGPGQHRELFEHDRRIFDEDRVGKSRFLGEPMDLQSELLERFLEFGVLLSRALKIDRLTREMRELTARYGGRDLAGKGDG
jgi:hypothetical protein